VVIHDLDIESVTTPPNEAQPELIIDPDTVLALSVCGQNFEVISAWNRQIRQLGSPMHDRELFESRLPNCCGNMAGLAGLPEQLRVAVFKAFDHLPS
jgi:hypothetical protein